MTNFWDFSAWGFFNLIAVLLVALMAAHMLKGPSAGWKPR